MAQREMVNCPPWIEVVEASAPAGSNYWRLKKVEFLEESKSGGRHHVDIMEPHDPSQRVAIRNLHSGEAWSLPLEKPQGEPAINHPMYGIPNRYEAKLEGAPSDALRGMEMHGNHHVVYRLWYERATKEGATQPPQPPQPPDPATSLNDLLLQTGEQKQILRFNPQAALQKAIFRDGFVPNSPEFYLSHGGSTYVGQRAERLSDGRSRVYYAKSGDFANVLFVEKGS